MYNYILLCYNHKWKKGSCTDLTIKDSIFVLKWIYDFVKNGDVWQLTFSKIFQTFRNNYVASSNFASLHEILRNSYEPCKMQIPRWKVVLQCCLHFCLGSWNIIIASNKTRVVVIIVYVYNCVYKLKWDYQLHLFRI